jgi:hypothetical protein
VATGRLYGIGLKRLKQDTQRPEDRAVCVQVYYVEQQPPYCGFDPNSQARVAFFPPNQTSQVLVQFVTRGNGVPMNNDGLPAGWDADQFPSGTIRPGDVIEINGTHYQLNAGSPAKFDALGYYAPDTGQGSPNKAPQIAAVAINGTGQMLSIRHDDLGFEIGTAGSSNPPFFTAPAPYKIHRQAVTTADEPFQMPEGTAIDLRASGLGYSDLGYFYWPGNDSFDLRVHDNDDPVIVLFTPEGKIGRLRYNLASNRSVPQIFDKPVVDNVFLLVGQRGKIPAPALDRDITLTKNYPDEKTAPDSKAARERAREPLNWLSGDSRWIVIGSQSGRIATVANAFVDPAVITEQYTQGPAAMALSSEPLRSQQIMAARGLTRETTQETAR